MNGIKGRLTRHRAAAVVLIAAFLLLALIGLRVQWSKTDCRTAEGRIRCLRKLGWEVDAASEEHRSVRLPVTPDDTLRAYNNMQKAQGFDLSRHWGETCEIYTYEVTNYPDCGQTVLAALYVQGRRIIAGDIHSTALDGFMHGLKRP